MALDIVEQAALTSGLLIVASGLAVSLLRKRLAARKALEPGDSLRIERARRVERTDDGTPPAGRRGARARLLIDGRGMTLHVPRSRVNERIDYASIRRVTCERFGRREILRVETGDADLAWEWTFGPTEMRRLASWLAQVGIVAQRPP